HATHHCQTPHGRQPIAWNDVLSPVALGLVEPLRWPAGVEQSWRKFLEKSRARDPYANRGPLHQADSGTGAQLQDHHKITAHPAKPTPGLEPGSPSLRVPGLQGFSLWVGAVGAY